MVDGSVVISTRLPKSVVQAIDAQVSSISENTDGSMSRSKLLEQIIIRAFGESSEIRESIATERERQNFNVFSDKVSLELEQLLDTFMKFSPMKISANLAQALPPKGNLLIVGLPMLYSVLLKYTDRIAELAAHTEDKAIKALVTALPRECIKEEWFRCQEIVSWIIDGGKSAKKICDTQPPTPTASKPSTGKPSAKS
jgi:hypothetical protein